MAEFVFSAVIVTVIVIVTATAFLLGRRSAAMKPLVLLLPTVGLIVVVAYVV